MVLKIVRWCYGYISIFVKGKRLSEFINKIAKNKISTWDITKTGEILYFKSASSEYQNILRLAKICGTKINIDKKKGLPFIYSKYKSRIGLIIGFFLFFFLINIFSLYIWSVNIDGIQNLKETEIICVLEEIGIRPGILKTNIEPCYFNQLIMEKFSSIAWVSVNIEGCCANISIKEKLNAPELISEKIFPKELKASRDGYIERMETYQGTPIVKVGDSVIKNQILITSNEEKSYSDAKVWAKTIHKIKEKISNTKIVKSKTGKHKNIYKLWLFGKILNFNFFRNIDPQWEYEVYQKNFKVGEIELPFKFYKETFCEFQENEIKLSEEESFINTQENIKKILESDEFKNIKILERNDKIINEPEGTYLEVTLKCFENIAI